MVNTNPTTEVLPSGLQVQYMGKRRQRAKYYRQITVKGGEMVWTQTELLPADVEGQAYYRSKGFRLAPPEGVEFALNNTVETQEFRAKAKADAEEKEQLYAEIAALKAKLEDKGKQEDSGKVGRPRKQEDSNG